MTTTIKGHTYTLTENTQDFPALRADMLNRGFDGTIWNGVSLRAEPPDPEWWPFHITSEGGGFGRFRWFNGDDQFWGECWWDEEKGEYSDES